jgi:hypothetical protein
MALENGAQKSGFQLTLCFPEGRGCRIGKRHPLVRAETGLSEHFRHKSLFVKVWFSDLKILYYGDLQILQPSDL